VKAVPTQLAPPAAKLPLNPEELAELSAHDRAQLYNLVVLDSFQRACAEEARRLVLAGRYPLRPPGPDLEEPLVTRPAAAGGGEAHVAAGPFLTPRRARR
jgi:hypothetical protein